MRVPALVLALALAACATTAPSGGDPLVGSWSLRTVNDRALPAASPDEDNVQIAGATLRLEPTGRYAIRMQARTAAGAAPVERALDGTYRVAADTVVMREDGPASGDGQRFRFASERGRLVLTDRRGNTYAFARAASAP